jgi:hypothetical protein
VAQVSVPFAYNQRVRRIVLLCRRNKELLCLFNGACTYYVDISGGLIMILKEEVCLWVSPHNLSGKAE